MDPKIVKALALIEDHHVEHGIPSVLEMRDIRARMEAQVTGHAAAAEMAHDTLMVMEYQVEMVDGVIYRLEQQEAVDALLHATAPARPLRSHEGRY